MTTCEIFYWKSKTFSAKEVVLSQLFQSQLQGGLSWAEIPMTVFMALPGFFHLAACLVAALPLQVPASSGRVLNNFHYIQVFCPGANLMSFFLRVWSGCSPNSARKAPRQGRERDTAPLPLCSSLLNPQQGCPQ